MTSVLLVCLGNICRSPTAAAVLRHELARAGLPDVAVDSAGTSGAHEGEGADPRSVRHAARRGVDLAAHRARRVRPDDFARFDHLWCMDDDNLAAMRARCPHEHASKLALFLGDAPVPDPYYGGPEGFDRVLDLCERAARRIIAERWAAPRRG